MEIAAAWTTADSVRRKERRAREVVAEALARIAHLNPALNAFTAVGAEQALRDADAVDAAIARGDEPGLLAGVPIGVKDLEAAAGLPHTMGSRVFAGRVAEGDSVQVARLKGAGAIVVGKTNTPEFGYKGFTDNLLYGATGNPWDPTRTPGGSSGGSAAAVAAGMVPLCTASDGGGSIRIPAAFSGCYGIKPSKGRIPRGGSADSHWAFLSHLGPVARTVRDAARYLDVASGPDPDDLESLETPPASSEAALASVPRLRRVAWSGDFGYAPVEPAVREVALAAARALADTLGAELVEANPGFSDPILTWVVIASAGDAAMHATWSAAQLDLAERGHLRFAEAGMQFTAVDYANAMRDRHALNHVLSGFFRQYDLLLTPTLPVTAFGKSGPPPQEIDGQAVTASGFIPFTVPFNLTGHPAASVPAGLAPDGLPVGLQIVGPHFADTLVLQASAAFERALPWAWPG